MECKVMHIGHDISMSYTMKEGDKITEFNGRRKRSWSIHHKRLEVPWTVCPVS